MDENPLFTIKNAGKGSPTIIVRGTEYTNEDGHQHGIIARYRPDPLSYPNQFWFICAGVGAVGTPAAAWHLVHNWQKYHKKYGAEDFLVLFRVGSNMAGYRSQTVVDEFRRSNLNEIAQ
jgi:hypothetical protein